MTTYRIVRMYFDADYPNETIDTSMYAQDIEGLTLEEAQAWCSDPETNSSTCKLPENVARTERYGRWFDGYEENA